MNEVTKFSIGVIVALILCICVAALAGAADKTPKTSEETMSLTTLRQMLGDKTKITSYQKYLWVERLKKKLITGEGVVSDVKRDVSVSGTKVFIIIRLANEQKNFTLVLRKNMIGPAANLSIGQQIKFKGRVEQPSLLDDTPVLMDGSFEVILPEKG